MDTIEKLKILADAAKYDASCSSSGSKRKAQAGGLGNAEGMGICHSYAPDGRCISLLKILLTNYCIFDCRYCVNRMSSTVKRARFTPQEVAQLTMDFYKRNYIEGLFLSSGVLTSPDDTMEELIESARLLRVEHKFNGYIHLKAVAGASQELTLRAGFYADRISANIEVPEQSDLTRLAPGKTHQQIELTMQHVKLAMSEHSSPAERPNTAERPGTAERLDTAERSNTIERPNTATRLNTAAHLVSAPRSNTSVQSQIPAHLSTAVLPNVASVERAPALPMSFAPTRATRPLYLPAGQSTH